MKKFLLVLIFLCGAGMAIMAEEAMPPAAYYDSNEIGKDLGVSLSQRPNFGVGRINSGGDYAINMIRRTAPAGAIVHEDAAEIHYVVEGAGVLTTGGVAVKPEENGVVFANIEGGYSQRVSVGDLIFIPMGTPHQYTSVEGVVGYLEVRFETKENQQ
tara:strand:- start:310 stop:780 length:471 start_codon:yes stop_codon:yes gene_type:complete